MRAIQISGYGGVDRLVLREMPDPVPGPGEILINVQASGVNFADLMARVGLYVQAPRPPFTPGFEVAGEIAAVGEGVAGLQPGRRVVALTEFGGYADRVVVRAEAVCPVPEGLTMEEAAALPVVGVTAYHAMMVQGHLGPSERVLIQAAAGGVGLAAVQMALQAGARVIAACGGPHKVEFLHRFGVRDVIDYRQENLPARVHALTGGEGLDLILDSLGGRSVREGISLLSPGGRLVGIGGANFTVAGTRNLFHLAREFWRTPWLNPMRLLGTSRSFIGVQMLVIGRKKPAVLSRALNHVMQEAAAGRLRPVIDSVLGAEQVGDAHRRLQSRDSIGKILLTWR